MAGLIDSLSQTWPARLAGTAWSAFTLPRDVYQGRIDPLSEQGITRATDLAGFMAGAGGFGGVPRGGLGSTIQPARSMAPERIERAAINLGDRIFTGPNHVTAIRAAEQVTGKSFDELLGLLPNTISTGFLQIWAGLLVVTKRQKLPRCRVNCGMVPSRVAQ